MAVNLAGPGEQETRNFFTKEGGVFLTAYLCMSSWSLCVHKSMSESSCKNAKFGVYQPENDCASPRENLESLLE